MIDIKIPGANYEFISITTIGRKLRNSISSFNSSHSLEFSYKDPKSFTEEF